MLLKRKKIYILCLPPNFINIFFSYFVVFMPKSIQHMIRKISHAIWATVKEVRSTWLIFCPIDKLSEGYKYLYIPCYDLPISSGFCNMTNLLPFQDLMWHMTILWISEIFFGWHHCLARSQKLGKHQVCFFNTMYTIFIASYSANCCLIRSSM